MVDHYSTVIQCNVNHRVHTDDPEFDQLQYIK